MDDVSFDELLEAEKQFLETAMPSHSHRSQDIIGNTCCSRHCSFFLRRIDIMIARFHYMEFYNKLNDVGKKESRIMFINTLKRVTDDGKIELISLTTSCNACPTLMARVFGMSVLFNYISDDTSSNFKSRPWYAKTTEKIGQSLFAIAKVVQFNSLDRIMLPPNFSSRTCTSMELPVDCLRSRMDLKIQERSGDSLTRCTSCSSLPRMIKDSKSQEQKKEAENVLRLHYRTVSQQRSIISALCKISRDNESDTITILADGMSNKHSRLPRLVSRAKCVSDNDLVPLSLTTVQLAQTRGSNLFLNINYPLLNGLYPPDSSTTVSMIFDALSKMSQLPSTVAIVMDSCRSNKSFVVLGAMGYLLRQVASLKKIMLIYPFVGHTHLSVDGHFGTIAKMIANRDILDPSEYAQFLADIESVAHVDQHPTIYDFSPLEKFVNRINNVCSSGFISIGIDPEGKCHYSTSITMNSSEMLFGQESTEKSINLFTSEFYDSDFAPNIRVPMMTEVEAKIENLCQKAGSILSTSNRSQFLSATKNYAIKRLTSEINSKPTKGSENQIGADNKDPHVTVLEFLKKHGYNVGRIPRAPTVRTSDLMEINTTADDV